MWGLALLNPVISQLEKKILMGGEIAGKGGPSENMFYFIHSRL
jgi:hypothetical protein